MTDDVRKLLGGYATGTLTEPERQQLFAAALEDQSLFEALADEEALRELLEDSAARTTLLQATEIAHFSVKAVVFEWFSRPKAKILAGLGCAALAAIAVQSYRDRPVEIAMHRPPALSAPQPPPPAATAPQEKAKEQKVARRKQRVADAPAPPPPQPAVKAEALAITPPPAVAETADSEAATLVAATAAGQFRYTLLRRDENGDDVAVPAAYAFAASDRVRLRVEPPEDGMLQVRGNRGVILFAGAVTAGSPVVIPRELTFSEDATHTIDIRFVPALPVPDVSRTEFRRSTAQAPAMRSQFVPSVSVQIVLRRKNN